METKTFWTIYHAAALTDGYEAAPLLFSIGSSFDDLEAALTKWAQADGVLVEQDHDESGLSNARIIGHLNEGKEALLASVSRAVLPQGEWQTHLTPIG